MGDVEVRVDVLFVWRGEVAEETPQGIPGADGMRDPLVLDHVGGVGRLVLALCALFHLLLAL